MQSKNNSGRFSELEETFFLSVLCTIATGKNTIELWNEKERENKNNGK